MSLKIPIATFTFGSDWKPLVDAMDVKEAYEYQAFSQSSELLSYLATEKACLIISSLQKKDDLVQLATFMKQVKSFAKNTVIKVVVVNFSGSKDFEKTVGKLGILDIVDPNTNTKALRFKIDFWMKSLKAQVKHAPQDSNVKAVTKEENDVVLDKKITDQIQWLAPLDCESDIWLLKKDADCKKVLSRWMVKLMGPSPYVAAWVEVKPKLWKFEFKEANRPDFLSGEGTWFFSGDQKPDFIWKENLWLITGEAFELHFDGEEGQYSKLKLKEKHLSFCKNSEFAKFKEKAIVQSFDKELSFKKDKFGGMLEGKGKTDHLDSDPYSGESSTDDVSAGHFSMDLEPGSQQEDLGGLEGPASGAVPAGKLLDLKTKTTQPKAFYEGHHEIQEDDDEIGDFSIRKEEHNEGQELDLKNKNHEFKTKYKGHNQAEEFEAGDLGGKGSTDHLKNHYDGEVGLHKEAAAKDYSGKAESEKAKPDHLKGKLQTKQEVEAAQAFEANRKRRFNEADIKPDFFEEAAGPQKNKKEATAEYSELTGKLISLSEVRESKTKASTAERKLEDLVSDIKMSVTISQGKIIEDSRIDDFFDQTVMFVSHTPHFQMADPVKVDLKFVYQEKTEKLSFDGKLEAVDGDGESSYFLSVEMNPETIKKFETFMDLFKSRQESISEFISMVKGL